MASFKALSYDKFVVVAEEEWKMYCEDHHLPIELFTRIGNYEWQCSLKNSGIFLECKELNQEIVQKIHIEVIAYYCTDMDSEKYQNYYRKKQIPERKVLKNEFYPNRWYYTDIAPNKWFLLTIRILEDRSKFPSFIVPNIVGNFSSNVKLRVGEQIYHVNKQLLGWFSPFFDRMFNGEFNESNQEEIELKKVEGLANPKVFEDFLLFFCPPSQFEILPNSQNVEDLLVLAQYFQVDMLKKKCERHLDLCREMDILERVLLTNKFGLKELQTKLVKGCTPEESQRICFALLDARVQ